MLVSELAKMVHENAVAHGWWDEEREVPEILALIHSEWSEALEEARAGRPLVWYSCGESLGHRLTCDPKDRTECRMYGIEEECEYRGHKPEGVAVELIDGCIRILDYMGRNQGDMSDSDGKPSKIEDFYHGGNIAKVPDKLPELIAYLHLYTSASMNSRAFHDLMIPDMFALCGAMAAALSWVKKQGLDPLAVLLEKHEYNKTRPYKHGKKF